VVDILKAIGHPIRFAIVDMLADADQLCVTDIYERLGIEQAVVSQHLKILKDKEVVDSRKQGKHCYYFLRIQQVQELLQCVRMCQQSEEVTA